jgi:hypothetical protein
VTILVAHLTHRSAVGAISPHVSHVQKIGLMVAYIAHSSGHGELFDIDSQGSVADVGNKGVAQ